jgi:hypothetical protein
MLDGFRIFVIIEGYASLPDKVRKVYLGVTSGHQHYQEKDKRSSQDVVPKHFPKIENMCD